MSWQLRVARWCSWAMLLIIVVAWGWHNRQKSFDRWQPESRRVTYSGEVVTADDLNRDMNIWVENLNQLAVTAGPGGYCCGSRTSGYSYRKSTTTPTPTPSPRRVRVPFIYVPRVGR